ncbi:hypothetical protein K3712_000531 [Escherichia coli]|nr:hypothetical protein [Escherichia coli]
MSTFTKTYDYVMLDSDPRMTKPMKEVYCYLLRFKESNSANEIFPSNQNIGTYTLNSPATVKRATKALQDIGLIQKTRRNNTSNLYAVMPYKAKDIAQDEPSTAHSEPGIAQGEPMDSSQRATIRLDIKLPNRLINKEEAENIKADDLKEIKKSLYEMVKELDRSSTVSKDSAIETEVSTVSPLHTVSSSTVAEFSSSNEAYKYVCSLGSRVTEKDFNYVFGSSGKYEEPELNISIIRIYE